MEFFRAFSLYLSIVLQFLSLGGDIAGKYYLQNA
jgi:hypothetical protein